MVESARLRELREIAEAQDAYGKWNTAPAWNRYYAERDREQPWRVVLRRFGERAFLAVGLLLVATVFLKGVF